MDDEVLIVRRNQEIACYRETADGWSNARAAANGWWPVWRPGRASFAYAAVDVSRSSEPRAVVRLSTPDGVELAELYRSPAGAQPIIGPRLPAYSSWSPDGALLATVGTSNDGLALYLSDGDGAFTSDAVLYGTPIFPAFAPGGRHIAAHTRNQLGVVSLQESRRVSTVDATVGGFRTPAWSPDGASLVFGIASGEGITVARCAPDGTAVERLRTFAGGLALAFRPQSRQLSVAVTTAPDTGMFDRLWLMNIDEPTPPVLVAKGPFASYHWSPTGEQVALVVPSQSGDGQYSVHCRLADGTFAGATEPFLPSIDYRAALGFFDQYNTSHQFWSPSGERFLVAGRLRGDSVSATFGDPVGGYVMTWQAQRGAPLEILAPGEIGFFRSGAAAA